MAQCPLRTLVILGTVLAAGTALYKLQDRMEWVAQWSRRRECRGCKRTRKSFDLVKIRAKFLKILTKSVEIWVKSVKTFAKSLKIWANSLKIQAKMAPNLLWLKNGAQFAFIWKNWSQNHTFFEVIWNMVFMHKKWPKIFSGKIREIRAKILCTP